MTPRDVVANAFFPCLSSEEEWPHTQTLVFGKKEYRKILIPFISVSLSGEKKKKKKRPPLLFSRTNFSLSLSLFSSSFLRDDDDARALRKKGGET